MELLLSGLIGVIIGSVLSRLSFIQKEVGVLKIETSDPDGPFLFLELSKDLVYIQRQKKVLLKVDAHGYLHNSQK